MCGLSWSAHAQTLEAPRARQGYYVMPLSYQLGAAQTWEHNESWKPWAAHDVNVLRAGQMITQHLGFGFQLFHTGGAKGQNQLASFFGGLGFEAQWEFHPNWAVIGGVGFDVVTIKDTVLPKPSSRGTYTAGYSLGVTYDWFFTHRLTGGWSLAPIAQTRLVPGNSIKSFEATLGLQICYWSGLPRNQLELPPDQAYQKP